jgi:sec-independent protein translocase protein TatA
MTQAVLPNSIFFALSAPGMGEWGVILVIVLVLFGGKNIPDLARALGNGIREFKRAANGIGDSDSDGGDKASRPAKPAEPQDPRISS